MLQFKSLTTNGLIYKNGFRRAEKRSAHSTKAINNSQVITYIMSENAVAIPTYGSALQVIKRRPKAYPLLTEPRDQTCEAINI